MDTHVEGTTQSGEKVTLYVEQEAKNCYVSVESDTIGYIQFNFNPDFPQDAKAFYLSLVEARSISVEA